jgi:hypothetical protein
MTEPVRTEALAALALPASVLPAGGDGADHADVAPDGAPVMVIENVPVFLAFTADLGWGYYDRFQH